MSDWLPSWKALIFILKWLGIKKWRFESLEFVIWEIRDREGAAKWRFESLEFVIWEIRDREGAAAEGWECV